MIFVTVGAQMAFDRLVHAVDSWVATRGRIDVFGQVGPTRCPPVHFPWTRFLDPSDFRRRVAQSGYIVAHAGIGTIVTALEYHKPILVMPRRGHLGETRNDHQVATVRHFSSRGVINVAYDEHELVNFLDELSGLGPPPSISPYASDELIAAVHDFIHAE